MPLYTNTALSSFREKHVDLDSGEVEKARKSRDFLTGQITRISKIVGYFPALNNEYLHYGSFARKTKVRPLDDIDMLVSINPGNNATSLEIGSNRYKILLTDSNCTTWNYKDDNNYLSSIRLLNKIRDSLYQVEHYQKAELKRSSNIAVVLNLSSYNWVFDIVPAIPVNGIGGTIAHYLIPDGNGSWMRTNPRIDSKSITDSNQYHNGNLLPIMRIIKYWNKKQPILQKLMPYYLETMLINAFSFYSPMTSIKPNIGLAFDLLASSVTNSCADPKRLGANLDLSMSWENRLKVQAAARIMASHAKNAINAENNNNHKNAMEFWKLIFPDFPTYG